MYTFLKCLNISKSILIFGYCLWITSYKFTIFFGSYFRLYKLKSDSLFSVYSVYIFIFVFLYVL